MKHWGISHILLVIAILTTSISVFAAPGIPHQFYGSVTINGSPAADGIVISAVIEGRTYNATTVNGEYGVLPGEPLFVEDPNSTADGETIQFFVEGQDAVAASETFSNGGFTQLNLSATVETPPSGGNGGGDGGGSGGGSGGGGGGGGSSSSGELKVSKTLLEINEPVTASVKCFWDNGCILKINGAEVERFAKNLYWQDYNTAFDTSGTKVFSLYKVGTAGILIGTKTIAVKAAEGTTSSDTNAAVENEASGEPKSFLCAGRNCDDGNACTVDVCQDNTTCNNIAMTDGTPCPGGTCTNGLCISETGEVIREPVEGAAVTTPPVGFAGLFSGFDGTTIAFALVALVIIIGVIGFLVMKKKKGNK